MALEPRALEPRRRLTLRDRPGLPSRSVGYGFDEARELTGFTIGGIPPFGHLRATRVIMDPDLGRFQVVWAAAGLPTAVFPVPPGTLRTLANAMVAPITEAQSTDNGSEPSLSGGSASGGYLDDGRATPQNAGV